MNWWELAMVTLLWKVSNMGRFSVKVEGQQTGVSQDTLSWFRYISSCEAHRMLFGHMLLAGETTPC